MPAKVEPTNDRELFEEAMFAERFIKSIKRNPDVPQPKIAGALDFVSIDCPTKAEFAKRDADGRYLDRYLDAMWFGWQHGQKHIAEAFAAHAKAEGELREALALLETIVCTEPPDDGVVLLSNDSPCHYDPEHKIQVYDHEHFSPLGDALIALHRKLKTTLYPKEMT